MYGCVKPICCPPEYCVRDYYTHRFIPIIHPVVNINRQNIIDVPQHHYQETTRNVVVDPGYQGHGFPGHGFPGHGFSGHGFPGHGFSGHGFQGHGFQGHGFQGHGFQGHGFQGRG